MKHTGEKIEIENWQSEILMCCQKGDNAAAGEQHSAEKPQ